MNYDHRPQVLANARCLYGSEIEVVIISHKILNGIEHQAAVMKRENDNSPWVNMLYGTMEAYRICAMESLLDKTEDELAKHLLGNGITLPLLGDDSTGFEVSHLVRSGSIAGSSVSSVGSEFEFIATPTSSSAGDFSEDESGDEAGNEQDVRTEVIPTSVEVLYEPIIEESPLQPSITPVEVSSDPLDSVNKTTDTGIIDEPQACGIHATATVIKNDNISDVAFKDTRHSPWEASPMTDLHQNQWKERSDRWAARKIPKDDIKSGPWADMVGELEELAQKKRYTPKNVPSFRTLPETARLYPPTAGPRKLYTNTWGPKWESEDDAYGKEKETLQDSLASTKRVKDDYPRKEALVHEVTVQVQDDSMSQKLDPNGWEHFNTSPILVETPATMQAGTKSKMGNITDDSSEKMVQTLAEWVEMGVPPEKMTKLRELMNDAPLPNAQWPSAWIQEVQESRVSTSNSTSEVPAFSPTAGFAVEEKIELQAKQQSLSDDLISTRTFRGSQGSLSIASHTSLDSLTSPRPSARVLSPADTDSWGVWPLPAKKKKAKISASNPPDISFQDKLHTSNSNPWSSTRKTNVPWREPEAILDEYDSSLWGISTSAKQKTLTKHTSLPAFSTRFSKNDVIYSPVALGVYPTYSKSDQKLRQQPGSSRQYATATVNRPTAKLPAVKPISKVHDWSQFGDQVKAPVPVILPKPESNGSVFHPHFEIKPKNPFEKSLDASKNTQSKSNAAKREPWNFGTFTSKPDHVPEIVPNAPEKDTWSWKPFAQTQNQQEKDIEKATNVVESKVSPWPYLEPESRPTTMASISHQSLLDDLAEWGSFGSKEKPKTKKPVAFDYLVETSLELTPKADFKHSKVAVKNPYDEFEWGSFAPQKKSNKKEKSVPKERTRYVSPGITDLSEDDGVGMGFGTFSVTTTSKQADSPVFSWNDFGSEKKKNTDKDDSTVSEMSGEDKPATAPVHVDAQKEFRTNILGLDKLPGKPEKPKKVVEAAHTEIPFTLIQPIQAARTRLYALNITYKHLLGTERFRHIIDASFTKKAAIIEEVTKFISAHEPFGQIYKRKIVIRSAKGEDGIIELERLEEGSWSDILGFLEDTTKIIEVTVVVDDI